MSFYLLLKPLRRRLYGGTGACEAGEAGGSSKNRRKKRSGRNMRNNSNRGGAIVGFNVDLPNVVDLSNRRCNREKRL